MEGGALVSGSRFCEGGAPGRESQLGSRPRARLRSGGGERARGCRDRPSSAGSGSSSSSCRARLGSSLGGGLLLPRAGPGRRDPASRELLPWLEPAAPPPAQGAQPARRLGHPESAAGSPRSCRTCPGQRCPGRGLDAGGASRLSLPPLPVALRLQSLPARTCFSDQERRLRAKQGRAPGPGLPSLGACRMLKREPRRQQPPPRIAWPVRLCCWARARRTRSRTRWARRAGTLLAALPGQRKPLWGFPGVSAALGETAIKHSGELWGCCSTGRAASSCAGGFRFGFPAGGRPGLYPKELALTAGLGQEHPWLGARQPPMSPPH